MKLRCTKCERKYPTESFIQRCEICNEPLELELLKGEIREGKTVWERYRDFYPFELGIEYSLGEGETPLTKVQKLSEELEVELYIKNETLNPTWSFKDRGTFVGIHRALKSGSRRIGTVSTGNMAASVASYGQRFGLETYILVSSSIPEEKLLPIAVYGPKLIKVFGDYGELYFRSLEIGRRNGIYFINSDDPFRIEGYKTISFEIAEIFVPDYVLIPTSSGGLFRGILKGFLELKESRIIREIPTLICVQARGCSPIYRAFIEGKDKIVRFKNPNTIAHAIENPYPPSGNDVLRKLRKYRGLCIAVSDGEILNAQRELAKEGIFVQPASAVGIAALKKLRGGKGISKGERVVSIITGSGLKFLGALGGKLDIQECTLEMLNECIGL